MVVAACGLKLVQKKRLPLYYLYIALPAIGFFLIFYAYYVRLYTVYPNFGAFLNAHGGILGSLFGTLDVSIAEAITINLSSNFI